MRPSSRPVPRVTKPHVSHQCGCAAVAPRLPHASPQTHLTSTPTPVHPVRCSAAAARSQPHADCRPHAQSASLSTRPHKPTSTKRCRTSLPHYPHPRLAPNMITPRSVPQSSHVDSGQVHHPSSCVRGRMSAQGMRRSIVACSHMHAFFSGKSAGLAPNICPTKDCKNPHGGLIHRHRTCISTRVSLWIRGAADHSASVVPR